MTGDGNHEFPYTGAGRFKFSKSLQIMKNWTKHILSLLLKY